MFAYRIGILGTVSSGKSTLINSIFAKRLTQVNIRRTTMTPQIYSFSTNIDHGDDIKDILLYNQETNSKFLSGWDSSTIREYHIANPPDFVIGNTHLQYKIYDLPGLNDADTKATYMRWAEDNFYLFDLAILVTDVDHIFNTSDEMDICKLIFRKMQEHPHINLIILINKCDNMDWNKDTNQLKCSDAEQEEIIQAQLMQNIDSLKESHRIENYRINIVRQSSKNAFVYRTIQHNSVEQIQEHIEERFLNEILESELGRTKWRTLTDAEKQQRKDDLILTLREERSYSSNMRYCGFKDLTNVIHKLTNEPLITESYYSKEVKNFIESEIKKGSSIFKNGNLKQMIDLFRDFNLNFKNFIFYVNQTSIPVEIKNMIIQKVINKYLDVYEYYPLNHTDVRLQLSKDNFQNNVNRIFDDIVLFQNFEDSMKVISYIAKINHSVNLYKKAYIYILENIKFFKSEELFRVSMEKIESFNVKYEISKDSDFTVQKMVNSYLCSELWGKDKFFDWMLKKDYKNIGPFLVRYIEEKMNVTTKENYYYLRKMRNQLRKADKDDASIFCENQGDCIWGALGNPKITSEEYAQFKDYDKRYGRFTNYLIRNFPITF